MWRVKESREGVFERTSKGRRRDGRGAETDDGKTQGTTEFAPRRTAPTQRSSQPGRSHNVFVY